MRELELSFQERLSETQVLVKIRLSSLNSILAYRRILYALIRGSTRGRLRQKRMRGGLLQADAMEALLQEKLDTFAEGLHDKLTTNQRQL